jgi:DNA polymerase-3 subunit alpha
MKQTPGHEPSKPTEPNLAGFEGASPTCSSVSGPPKSSGSPVSEQRILESGATASKNFVHLHLHTDYSLLDGACEIGELTAEAARRGMPAVAVTDHGNLFAAANFYHQATTHGVKPIIGCEMYVAPDNHKNRGTGAERSNHLVLLCENEKGYQNLIKLVSTGYLDGFYYKPRVDHELLAKHSEGLIALSACLRGEVADALLSEKYDQAQKSAYRLRDIFGKGNFFLEVQDQGLEPDLRVNRDLVRLSKESGIPLVATNDCHYLTQADSHAQEVLMCIQTAKKMSDTQHMKFATDQFYFKTAEEMAQVFRELPDAVTRTVAIAERCNVKIQRVSNPFPEFKVPEGHTTDSYFEQVVRDAFASRAPQIERLAKEGCLRHPLADYETRLTAEIEMIKKMRFAGYFLIVWDFIHYARAQGVPVGPGRGSAAGSLVSYSLHITDVDPMQYELLFERFLNPERISMPDIDVDLCMRRRAEVIEYVRQKYGEKNVAQIITFGKLGAKAALKDAGRALDMPYGDVDRLAKLVPNRLNITLEDALKQSVQLAAMRKKDQLGKGLLEVALRLEGLARHASTHAAGVVIAPQPLNEIVPLYKTKREEITTQYDMNALEHIGLLKMDFLGLATLTVLNDAVHLIEQNRGINIDISVLPFDDEATYRLFARADTTGIFQFESDGMRDILRRSRPAGLDDLTALNALYRPGPIQGGMIDDFIACKHGKKKITYDLPELDGTLSETYGVMTYQEQVMQIANRVAGFSLGEADILRRAISKKKREEMAAQREKFLAGCTARNVPVKKAEHIFDLMAKFAEYGFNKSHACAYALLAYRTAWLKTHYPVEFMAALLSSEIGNRDKLISYSNECREMGIQLLPPDVNSSEPEFRPEGNCIRFGLAAIRNVGDAASRSVVVARKRLNGFRDFRHFYEQADSRPVSKGVMESLIKAGALDSLGLKRAHMIALLAQRRNHSGSSQRSSTLNRSKPASLLPAGDVAEWSQADRLAREKEVLGVYLSGHPLDGYRTKLSAIAHQAVSSLWELADNTSVVLVGMPTELAIRRSRKGNLWGTAALEDLSGRIELVVFAQTLESFQALMKSGAVAVVKGRIRCEAGAPPKVLVGRIEALNANPAH